ncbi:MAG: sulfurtransferase complex subunit TusB [Pseudomonadota bacterium]
MTVILHTVNKSPGMSGALAACLRFRLPGDALLLLEDGVYAALDTPDSCLRDYPDTVYALSADVIARGLNAGLLPGVSLVDYPGFVTLCTQYDSVKNWS